MECVRSITFIIPGVGGAPDVQVVAVENNREIDFIVTVLPTADGVIADLRGLFFDVDDASVLSGMDANGADVTDFDTEDVINLGQGANMNGAADPFDVVPESDLENLTKLGFNIGGGVDVLSASAGYDASFTFFGETVGFADSVGFGPLYSTPDFNVPIADIEVFNDTFDQETIMAFA